MSISLKKTAISAFAALTLGLALVPVQPAYAWDGHGGGGYHGGWGGGGGGYHGGWDGRHHHGGWGGGAAAAGIIGALALGALAVNASRPSECWVERRPIFDAYGYMIGRRPVRVCE